MREGRHAFSLLYTAAAAISVLAAAALFWKGRTVYHHLQAGTGAVPASDITIIYWSVVVLQIAYWLVLRKPVPFRIPRNFLLSSIMLFLSRLSFMLAGALFSIVIFIKFEQIHIGMLGYLRFGIVLFAIFCFSRWLESLGRAFEAGAP